MHPLHLGFVLRFLAIASWGPVADSSLEARDQVALPPPVTVEEGGIVVLPCNGRAVTGCYVVQPPAGFFMTAFLDGGGRNASAVPYNDTHCACSLPPGDAEAPVDISFVEGSSKPAVPAGRVEYVALWTTALARRPYLSTDVEAEVVVSLHHSVVEAAVSLQLGDEGATLLARTPVPSGVALTLRFSLAALPAAVQLLPLTLTLTRGNGESPSLTRRLYLSRVTAPPASLGSFVQVDYARKTLLVNGAPFLGVGYYDSQSIGPSNFSRQAAAGINWGMRYLKSNESISNLQRKSDAFIQDYFDWSHRNGMYVMFDLYEYIEALATFGNSTELWANISGQVMKFRTHPALLGYYVCDDCTTQYLMRQEAAKTLTLDLLYRALKDLDPYHPVIGAEESANAYTFTTANARIPAPSLDLVMIENYVDSLSSNAHTGGVDSPGMDGSFGGWPLTWEPIVNCPGPWLIAQRNDLSDAEKALNMYSMSWLSAVLANLPQQLYFRLFPLPADPIYERILAQVGRYAKVARQVQDFLFAPPSGVPEPWLAPSRSGPSRQAAALWRRTGPVFCAVVVVVNTENSTATADFRLEGAGQWPSAAFAHLRRVDGSGDANFRGGRLMVTLAAYDTHVYASECELVYV